MCPPFCLSAWSVGFHLPLQLWILWGRQLLCLCSTLAQNIILQDIVFYMKNLHPWEQGLKHALTCNLFTPFLDFITLPSEEACMHRAEWWCGAKVLHVASGACLPLRLFLASSSTTILALALQHLNFPLCCRGHRISLCSFCWLGVPWQKDCGVSKKDPHLTAEESPYGN